MNPQRKSSLFSQPRHWQKTRRLLLRFLLVMVFLLTNPFCFPADNQLQTADDLTLLPFEELVRVKVTTVSRKPEQLFDSASAVYVITGEDIQRSGYTTV